MGSNFYIYIYSLYQIATGSSNIIAFQELNGEGSDTVFNA